MKNYYFMADLLQHSWCRRLPGSSFHTYSSLQVQEGGRAKFKGTRGREGKMYRYEREGGQNVQVRYKREGGQNLQVREGGLHLQAKEGKWAASKGRKVNIESTRGEDGNI